MEVVGLQAEPMLMPSNFQDTWWVITTVVTILLLGISVFFLKRLVDKQDRICDTLNAALVEQRAISVRLDDHMADSGRHCKGVECPSFQYNRRATDN